MNNLNISRLAQLILLLEEFELFYVKVSVDEAIHVLSVFKHLQYFRFIFTENFDCDQMKSHLRHGWSMQLTTEFRTNFITLKRLILRDF